MPMDTLPLSDSPAGRLAAGYLAAFNSGDQGVMDAFAAEHYAGPALAQRSVKQRAAGDAALYRYTRGFTARRIERSTETEIMVLLQTQLDESWARLHLIAEGEFPQRITSLTLSPAPRPVDGGPRRRLSEPEIVHALGLYMDTLVAADVFSGAVLVAKDGVPIVRAAYGLASAGYSVPNQIDTAFNIGSMNKMFTGVAIAQLAEQGKLSFAKCISSYLPDYPRAVADKVTIHHLLTHTSGMGSYWNEKFDAAKTRLRTVNDFLALCIDDPLSFEPGERYQYSNAGYIVLGAIVEAVSGQDYYDYVRTHIFGPAGMARTDAYELDRDVPNLAIGYTHTGPDGLFDPGPRRNNLFMHGLKGGPAGGGYSTVEDLLHFATALQTHQLLTPEYTELALRGKVDMGGDARRAYGFGEHWVNGTRIVGHRGGFPGINGCLEMHCDQSYVVAVLANYDPPAAGLIADRARDMLI
jgi:CubicO group peptidase (beta-lactamase class C family)